jgi:hypothetical protein
MRGQRARTESGGLPAIVQLVCGKADACGREWDALLMDDSRYAVWGDLVSSFTEEEDPMLKMFALLRTVVCLKQCWVPLPCSPLYTATNISKTNLVMLVVLLRKGPI